MNLLLLVYLFLQGTTVVYGCSQFWSSWHSWTSCSASCGGGTSRRVRHQCYTYDEDWQTETCNGLCFNGGTFLSGRCNCPSWRTGRCCDGRLSCREQNGGCDHTCLTVTGEPQCRCNTGYKLSSDEHTCLDINECSTGDAKCSHHCTNTPGSFICSCPNGYQLDSDGLTCSDIDECVTGDAKCSQSCINTEGSFRCECKPGFELQHDEITCNDTNECLTQNGGCSDICVNEEGSYHCSCMPGYILDSTRHLCIDVDECLENTHRCNQHCHNLPGTYNCSCDQGYKLGDNGHVCIDSDDCIGVHCQHEGSCADHLNSFTCDCKTGYIGRYCENDVDECADFLQGGCEDMCINTIGSYSCFCTGNKTLNQDGRTCSGMDTSASVFSRYGIVRRMLPRGCSTVLLTRCKEGKTFDISMSSTAPWYRLNSNNSIIYTFGIVFVEMNALSLPMSLTGIKVSHTDDDFIVMAGSLSFSVDDGTQIGLDRTDQCVSFSTTPRDVVEFMKSGSFLKSFFNNLLDYLPDWLSFSMDGTDVLEMKDLRTSLLRGKDLSLISACRGAPVLDNRLYTVLKFGSSFSFSIYGNDVVMPAAINDKEFCVIIDICQDYGGSMFLMIPEESRSLLDDIDIFKQLKTKYGLEFRPVGLGLSLFKHINNPDSAHVKLWNGDELFQYPSIPEANLWFGGDIVMTVGNGFVFRMESRSNLYASVPDPSDMLKSIFLDEWNILMRMEVLGSIGIQFELFGRDYYAKLMNVGAGVLDAYASLGGHTQRKWCGEHANPPGFYVSLMVDVNPFIGIPILEDIIFDFNSRIYAFLASDPSVDYSLDNKIYILKDVIGLKQTLDLFINTTVKSVFRYRSILTNESLVMLSTLRQTAIEFGEAVDALVAGGHDLFKDISAFIKTVSGIWSNGWKKIQHDALEFTDSVEKTTEIVKYNFSHIIDDAIDNIDNIENHVIDTLDKVKYQIMSVYRNVQGFGLRYKGILKIFHIEIAGLEMELVYSENNLGSCSRFSHVYDLLKGERAVRIYAVVSTGLIKILPFIRLHAGGGIGVAISRTTPGHMVVQMHVETALLGIKEDQDVFLTNTGVHFICIGSIWNTFKTRLDVSLTYDDAKHDHGVHIIGIFLANAGDGTSFQDSYLDAIQKITTKKADAADKRISQAQAGLTVAQNAFTKAQNWLEEKKAVIRSANSAFDTAVNALEKAKQKLEDAKRPFRNALSALNDAKRKVDSLCRIKTCGRVCVPGLKCEIHWKKVWFIRIPYPSCRFTSCMFSFPNPICVAFNLGCRAIRGIAYLALEAAKIAVRIPMLALDAAKLVVSGAQFVVDKSRVVLDIAIAAVDLAELGLEGAKGVLEEAQFTLEGIKQVVGWGIKALNFIIEYGIKSIADVRNCGFELTTTVETQVFQIQCEINLFRSGFRKINIGVNFGNPVQSIWQASKNSIDAIIDETQHSVRRKREAKTIVNNVVNKLIRHSRNANVDDDIFETFIKDTLDAASKAPGFNQNVTPSDYDNRVEHFKEKCSAFNTIHSFLSEATQILFEMSNETADVLSDASKLDDSLSTFNMNEIMDNFTSDNIGIDPNVAENEFNISSDEIDNALAEAKANLSNDPLLSGIDKLSADARSLLRNQTDNVNNMDIINHWLLAMDNITTEYFSNDTCISFMDCAHYAVSELYGLYDAENITYMDESIDLFSDFEDLFLELTANRSHTIVDVRNITQQLENLLVTMDELNMFCSEAPHVVQKMTNQTLYEGSTLMLRCGMTGNPTPEVWWYRDDVYIQDSNDHSLVIQNVSRNDSTKYYCVAGNIVANLTSEVVDVTVLEEEIVTVDQKVDKVPFAETVPTKQTTDTVEISPHKDESDATLVVTLCVSLGLLGVVGSVVAVVIWRAYTRRRIRKDQRPSSRASISSVMTSNMVRPVVGRPAFKTAQLTDVE